MSVATGWRTLNWVPITPASRFMVASISEPMTAMSILLLAEAGKLSMAEKRPIRANALKTLAILL